MVDELIIQLSSSNPVVSSFVTGKSAGCSAFLPLGRGGEESQPYHYIYVTRKPRPLGEELH